MKRSGKRRIVISMILGAVIAAGVTGIRGGFSATDQKTFLAALCDGCFVAGALLACCGLLVYVADDGFFDMMNYGVQKVLRLVLSEEKQATFPKSFYEFRRMKNAGRKGGNTGFLLVVGLCWIALAVLWLILYSGV